MPVPLDSLDLLGISSIIFTINAAKIPRILYIAKLFIENLTNGDVTKEPSRCYMTRERKVLAKTLATHEAQIDRLSSYADGVFHSRRVYNSNLVVFICSLVANVAFIILTVILWLNK